MPKSKVHVHIRRVAKRDRKPLPRGVVSDIRVEHQVRLYESPVDRRVIK